MGLSLVFFLRDVKYFEISFYESNNKVIYQRIESINRKAFNENAFQFGYLVFNLFRVCSIPNIKLTQSLNNRFQITDRGNRFCFRFHFKRVSILAI